VKSFKWDRPDVSNLFPILLLVFGTVFFWEMLVLNATCTFNEGVVNKVLQSLRPHFFNSLVAYDF
jgi:hypothetical protein